MSPSDKFFPALIGAMVWISWIIATGPSRAPLLLMLSPFVLVPLGLVVVGQSSETPQLRLLSLVRIVALPAALCAAFSFSAEKGSALAGLLTVPWLMVTIALSVIGLIRLGSRRSLSGPGFGVDVGLMLIVVGGGWLTISRLGLDPGFGEAIVLLTAVHFHYAGFALPLVAGTVAERLGWSWRIPAAVTIGVPLTAVGITVGGTLEWAAATLMAIAGLAVAAMLLTQARTLARSAAPDLPFAITVLFAVAGLALTIGMSLSLVYAWSIMFDLDGPTIDTMVATHGALNALGFGLLAMIAIAIIGPAEQGSVDPVIHLGRPSKAHLSALRALYESSDPVNTPGLLARPLPDGFRRDVFSCPIEHGDRDRARSAIEAWAGHQAAGIRRVDEQPPIEVGSLLAMAIPVGPLAVTAVARIVEVIDDERGWGFCYSTLDHHPVSGEESFILTDTDDGLRLVVTAVWQPARLVSGVLPPVTRFLQRRALGRYLAGVATHQTVIRI